MKITANQMTILRMVLLPIPCYLLFGERDDKTIALFLFTVIGLTDYLDGYLARKQGPTTLGRLMDPIADKIFITALYIPLAKMEIVPLWMVLLLFVREYSITELRSIYATSGLYFRTSELAKYKTSIQMIGAGFIIFIEISGSSGYAYIPIAGLLLGALALTLIQLRMTRRLNPKCFTAMCLISVVLLVRWIFPYRTSCTIIMAHILGITLLSGFQYLIRSWAYLRVYLSKQFSSSQWISFLGIGLAFPLIYVSISHSKEISPWIIITLLSIEFAIGGLNNLLTTVNAKNGYIAPTKKVLFQVIAGSVGLALLLPGHPYAVPIVFIIMLVVLVTTSIYSIRHFYIYRNYFLNPLRIPLHEGR